jgi:hypothetical protein
VQLNIRYVRSGGASIAYQVVGSGPTDLVFLPEVMSNLVYGWEWPRWRNFYEELASFSRLILFDKRGTGLSDHCGGLPTLETRIEDVRAVLDAVGSRKTVVLAGMHEMRDGLLIRDDVSGANESARALPTGIKRRRRLSLVDRGRVGAWTSGATRALGDAGVQR